jgi:hypothetical protein
MSLLTRIIDKKGEVTENSISTSGSFVSKMDELVVCTEQGAVTIYRDDAARSKKNSWIVLRPDGPLIQLDRRGAPKPKKVKAKPATGDAEPKPAKKRKLDETGDKPAKKPKAKKAKVSDGTTSHE